MEKEKAKALGLAYYVYRTAEGDGVEDYTDTTDLELCVFSVPLKTYRLFIDELIEAATILRIPCGDLEFFATLEAKEVTWDSKELGMLCLRQRLFSLLRLISEADDIELLKLLEMSITFCLHYLTTDEPIPRKKGRSKK